jgi:hypothetical protein
LNCSEIQGRPGLTKGCRASGGDDDMISRLCWQVCSPSFSVAITHAIYDWDKHLNYLVIKYILFLPLFLHALDIGYERKTEA